MHRIRTIGLGAGPVAILGLSLLTSAAVFTSQTTRQERPRTSTALLREAIERLTDEAREAMDQKRLARQDANFARDFRESLSPVLVGSRLSRRLHHDSFVDAYVRWQLTSFQPKLSDMTDRQFARFLADLPGFMDNPRADPALLADLNAAVRAGVLNAKAQAEFTRQLDTLAEQTSRAQDLNGPANRLRNWIRKQLPATGSRALHVELARCGALINAGWNIEHIRTQLDELFAASAENPDFTDQQRLSVAQHARQLIDRNRLYVVSARLDGGAVTVQYNDAGVYDFDVRRWIRSLAFSPDP